jgi:hypothetical protein
MPLENYEFYNPPPFALDTLQMNRKETQQYFDWFLLHIPTRIEQLKQVVRREGIEINQDYTEEALFQLGTWFDYHVKKRSLTSKELEQITSKTPTWFHNSMPRDVITEKTISMCIDLGIYFGETLRHTHSSLHWDIVHKPKSDADYHQPILLPFRNRMQLNPVRILTVIANKVAGGETAAAEIPRIFGVWREMAL